MNRKILLFIALLTGLLHHTFAQCPQWNLPANSTFCTGELVPEVEFPIEFPNGKVLVLAGDYATSYNDVKTKLEQTGFFVQVDVFDAKSGSPTLAQLRNYDGVLAYAIDGWLNPVMIGDTLAAYINEGGGVVVATFANGAATQTSVIGGAFATESYQVIIPESRIIGYHQTLGTIHLPIHPIMSGVTNFEGGYGSFRPSSTTLTSGSYRIADWNDGNFLITAKDNVGPAGVNRVDLGFFPPSGDGYSSGWVSTSDGAKIMANSLKYVMPSSSYTWTNNNTSIGLAASGVDSIPAFTTTNTTNAPSIATITVTLNNPPIGCIDTIRTYTITVNPDPIVDTIAPISLCNEEQSAVVSFTSSASGTLYKWTNDNPNIGLAASGIGDIPSFTASNNTNTPQLANVTVTPLFPNQVSSIVSFDWGGREVTYTDVSINGGTNSAIVSPGSTNTLFFNAQSEYTGYCPGCVYQQYIGIGGSNSTIFCANYSGSSTVNYQANNVSFTAPTVSGVYYLTFRSTLDYVCQPGNFDNSKELAIAVIYVDVEPNCEGESKNFTITVNPTPTITITQPNPVCEPNKIVLKNTIADFDNANTYTYFRPNGNQMTGGNPSAANSGAFKVVVTSLAGCKDSAIVNTVIYPKPVVLTHNPASQCSPSTVDLTTAAITAGSTANLTYSYWLNAASTQAIIDPTAVTHNGNKLYYIVGSTNEGCSDTSNVLVTFLAKPNVTAYNPPPICSGASANITLPIITYGSTPNLAYTYWNSSNQNITSSANALGQGSYYIVGTNSSNCKDTAEVIVSLNPACNNAMNGSQNKNAFTQTQNGINNGQQIVTRLYPNPASHTLYFEYDALITGTVQYYIKDATGRTLSKQQYNSSQTGLQKIGVDISKLAPGMYYFNFMIPESTEQKTIKFVVTQ